MQTINETILNLQWEFMKLSASRRYRLANEARILIAQHPHAADHSTFWKGLSANHVLAAVAVQNTLKGGSR